MRFLKKPDFLLVDEEDIAERQHQLQEYLNSILQCHAYRNMPETVSAHSSYIGIVVCILFIAYLLETVQDFLCKFGMKPQMLVLERSIFSLNNVIVSDLPKL